jgi:hypothetical protein
MMFSDGVVDWRSPDWRGDVDVVTRLNGGLEKSVSTDKRAVL